MPPDRGRASRACTSCRKQKTRCYDSGVSGTPCLRCERLNQRCSFVQDPIAEEEHTVSELNTSARLERLEKVVANLLDRLGEDSVQLGNKPSSETEVNKQPLASPGHVMDKASDSAAPMIIIRDLAADTGIELPNAQPQSMVLDGLISPSLALTLITIFFDHYGRWVLFDPDQDPNDLLQRVNKSPLLFSACCLIAVRHTSQELAANLAPKLYECARSLVQTALLVSPQPIEFFQATLVLCMWSTTVGQVPLGIDSWLLSGFALQHCQSSSLFTLVTSPNSTTVGLNKDALDNCLLWNHLCLVHQHYCVGTSRKSVLQDWQIERCRAIVNSDHATNYELRMVAEIHLYWTVYKHLTENSVDIAKSVAGLQVWRKDWQFVLEQPRAQFLMMGFHFCYLLLYDRCLASKPVRAQESIISEMISHSTAILRLAMDTMDERTRHLSDHIYHMITFAAIIICRLIGSSEHQLHTTHNVKELDSLINSLVQWLQSIGLPCHAAYTLGTIISQVHRKMLPQVDTTSFKTTHTADFLSEDFTRYYFPEFLGVGTTSDGSWDLAANFPFFPQDTSLPNELR